MHRARQRKKAARVLLVQHSTEACANLLVALYNGLLNTFLFRLLFSKPHSNSSNALDTLELHATLLMPNLARYSCVHACEVCKKKVILPCLGPKKLSSLFMLAFDLDDKIRHH